MLRSFLSRRYLGALLILALLATSACSDEGTSIEQIDFNFADKETLAAPDMLAAGEDLTWFSVGGRVAAVDAATREISTVFEPTENVLGLLADGNSLWIALEDGTLTHVEADGTTIGESMPFLCHEDDLLTVSDLNLAHVGEQMWVARPHRIMRVHLETSEILSPIEIELAGSFIITEGAVWTSAGGRLMKLDPESGEVITEINLGNAGPSLALANGTIWALTSENLIHRLNAETLEATGEAFEFGDDDLSSLVYGGGFLWSRISNQVVRINPQDGDILERYSLKSPYSSEPAEVAALQFGGGALWVGTAIGNRAGVIELE